MGKADEESYVAPERVMQYAEEKRIVIRVIEEQVWMKNVGCIARRLEKGEHEVMLGVGAII